MVTIKVKNVKSTIDKYIPLLEERLSTFHPNYWHSTKYKAGEWDGKTHFMDLKTGKFPTGHLHIVTDFLNEEEMPYQIIDERREDPVDIDLLKYLCEDMLHGITLRIDQIEAIGKAILLCRGVIHMPTGTGKTEVAIGITKILNLPTLFLVNSKSLLHQTQERFIKRLDSDGEEIGIIGDGINAPGTLVTVATVQSFDHMKERSQQEFSQEIRKYRVIIFDECHHASAKTWYTVGTWAHNAYYRFGFSGTPMDRDEIDSMKLMSIMGQTIYKRKTTDAIEDGDLCKIEMEMIENKNCVSGDSWGEIYTKGIVRDERRNALISTKAIEHKINGDKVLILVRHIEHGIILSRMLQRYPVHFLYGSHTHAERETVIHWFNDGAGKILIASGIFDEGIDIPEINVLIVASGGKSDVKTIQRIGRGLRKKLDGGSLKAYDFIDHSEFLLKHSIRRASIYEREGYLQE